MNNFNAITELHEAAAHELNVHQARTINPFDQTSYDKMVERLEDQVKEELITSGMAQYVVSIVAERRRWMQSIIPFPERS